MFGQVGVANLQPRSNFSSVGVAFSASAAQSSAFPAVLLPAGGMVQCLAVGADDRFQRTVIHIILDRTGADRAAEAQPVGFFNILGRDFNWLAFVHQTLNQQTDMKPLHCQ